MEKNESAGAEALPVSKGSRLLLLLNHENFSLELPEVGEVAQMVLTSTGPLRKWGQSLLLDIRFRKEESEIGAGGGIGRWPLQRKNRITERWGWRRLLFFLVVLCGRLNQGQGKNCLREKWVLKGLG